MSPADTLDYHLSELRIAQDPSHPAHILPPAVPSGSRILDVGCGAGQTLIAAYADRVTFGIDIDFETLQIGSTWTDQIRFVCGKAEGLPFRNDYFNLVIARVSLAYTNIRPSLREIHRVLQPGGTLWMTLHPLSIPWNTAKQSGLRGKVYFAYIAVNSLCFHFVQRQVSFFGRYESFQTERGIRRALYNAGFTSVTVTRDRHFVVTAHR